ncbi:MAG: divergent polysaccharide deacetylase family protein [Deltaproteobacteria bacterium]|nr:divergent polysaccharide deacetylase family protein [Deltaproteobacteria bacterium]
MGRGPGGRNLTALFSVALGFAAGAGAAVLIIFYLGYGRRPDPPHPPLVQGGDGGGQAAPIPEGENAAVEEPAVTVAPIHGARPPRVAIVIDDMGANLKALEELLKIDAPITFAVLPRLSLSKDVAEAAYSNGHDVLLHLPMEPKPSSEGQKDPDQGALLTSMSAGDVRTFIEEDLKDIPHASGINNHMGSKFTEDEALMRAIMEVVREKNLFFLDSLTTPASVGSRLAKKMGVKGARRNVFLDNTRDEAYIKAQINGLAAVARKRGKAVAIGHPYPETIAALKEAAPALKRSGIEVVRLSEIIE